MEKKNFLEKTLFKTIPEFYENEEKKNFLEKTLFKNNTRIFNLLKFVKLHENGEKKIFKKTWSFI